MSNPGGYLHRCAPDRVTGFPKEEAPLRGRGWVSRSRFLSAALGAAGGRQVLGKHRVDQSAGSGWIRLDGFPVSRNGIRDRGAGFLESQSALEPELCFLFTGGSGGAYTSLQVADAFPGLFDGISISATFPDALSIGLAGLHAHLLFHYWSDISAISTPPGINAMQGPNV